MYELINKVKELNPLVLHYTNNVTITDCANMTLAIGASPLMSFSYEEVEDMVSVASAVVINIGTMNSPYLDLFVKAGKAANKFNKPVVLDPVGVFASKARTELTNKLLNEVQFTVVRGNISEIKFIGGLDVAGKGVDSFDDGSDASDFDSESAGLRHGGGFRRGHRGSHSLEGADAAAPGVSAGSGGAGRHLLRHLRLLPPGQPGNRHGPCHGPVLCEHPGQHHGGSGIPQVHHPLRLRRGRGYSG